MNENELNEEDFLSLNVVSNNRSTHIFDRDTSQPTYTRPMSTNEAADYLGISISTLYKYTSSGKIQCYKPAKGKVFFYRTDLDDWVKKGKVTTKEEIEQQSLDIRLKYDMDNKRKNRNTKGKKA